MLLEKLHKEFKLDCRIRNLSNRTIETYDRNINIFLNFLDTLDVIENTLVAQDQTVKVGERPNAEASISNLLDLPTGTTVTYKDPVDTTTPGNKDATVVVTYPNGSTEEITVTIKVVTHQRTHKTTISHTQTVQASQVLK